MQNLYKENNNAVKPFDVKNAHILIVDDQQDNIDVLTGLMEVKGYTNIETTTDPRLIIDIYKKFNPDLILLDLMMPHLNGFQVMDELKKYISQDTYLPILVLTADVSPEAKKNALKNGAKDFITKPFDLIEVDLRINNLLETRYLHLQQTNQNQILENEVRKRMAELEEANKELHQLDKAKSDFLRLISHEINTPLNGILGFISILKDELKSTAQVEMLEYLESSAKRLGRFAKVSFDITRLKTQQDSIEKDYCHLGYFTELIKERYIETIKSKGIKLTFDGDINSLRVLVDIKLAEFCFDSLLRNALYYSPEGGEILVEIAFSGEQVFCSFIDQGPGFSTNALKNVYSLFAPGEEHTDKNKGLDLVLVKLIMEAHGGEINIKNNEKAGATVSLSFPDAKKVNKSKINVRENR